MATTVPIRINTTDNQDLSHPLLFEYLAPQRLYMLAFNASSGPSVYKSLDGGATWSLQDDSNGPGYNIGSWDVVQVGTQLVIAGTHATAGQFVKIIIFDTATDTWGAESANGPAFFHTPPAGAVVVRVVEVSSGDLWVFVNISSGSNARDSIGYAIFSGGVWSGVTNFVVDNATPTFNFLQQVVVDSANLIHVIYKKNTFGDMNASLYHKSVTVGGVQGTEDVINLTFTPYNCGRSVAWVNPVSSVESVVVPYYDSSNNLGGVWVGTPAAIPVWTFTLVDTKGWAAGYKDYGLAVPGRGSVFAFLDSASNLYLAWASHDPTFAVVNAIYFAKNDGTGWGTPTLYYDEIGNPPSWSGDFINAAEMWADSFLFLDDGSLASVSNIDSVGEAWLPPMLATIEEGKFRLQIYDDGAGEYLFNESLNSLIGSGSEDSGSGLSGGAIGPFILPSPLVITKPGLVTISLSNVNGSDVKGSVMAYVGIVFAIPKKCRKDRNKTNNVGIVS